MTPFDYTSTARRPGYPELPALVRKEISDFLGGEPDEVSSAGGGFTPGFAGTVRRADRLLFVKAASARTPVAHPAYCREAALLAELPPGLPVPRLLGSRTVETGDPASEWVVLFLQHIEGTMPGSPWTAGDAESVQASLVELDHGLRGLPPHLVTGSFTDGLVEDDAVMSIFRLRARNEVTIPFLPAVPVERWLELQHLVEQAPSVLRGPGLVHNDLRPDNIIIERHTKRAYVCDWNFLSRGPAWADWAGLLPYLHHDGLDADALLTASRLAAGVSGDDVDTWLAVLAAYLTVSGLSAEVSTSPRLRAHGRFSARIVVDWLSERRAWWE